MKNLSFIIALLFAFTTTTFAQIGKNTVQHQLSPAATTKVPKTKFQRFDHIKLTKACPDPAATAINFSLVRRFDQFRANVKIEGIITNQGSQFNSGRGQQVAVLYEIRPGGRPIVKARRAFGSLASGQSVSVSFVRHWNTSSPAEGEFPPTYRVCIEYDPDIRLDGNKANDDCTAANNCKSRRGSDIHRLFRRTSR